jgi:hypothetical protein
MIMGVMVLTLGLAMMIALGIFPPRVGPSASFCETATSGSIEPYYNGADAVYVSQCKDSVQYFDANIVVVSTGIAGAGVSLALCGAISASLCIAAAGASTVAVLASSLGTPVMNVSTTLTFKNEGNSVANDWSYKIFTVFNGETVANQTIPLKDIAAGQSVSVPYSQTIVFGQLPSTLWGAITQRQTSVSFIIQGPSPPSE